MLFKYIDYFISLLTPGFFMGGGGSSVAEIGHSLRLRGSASAYLSRTFGTPTTAAKGCFSAWVKRGALGSASVIFGAGSGTASEFGFNTSNQIYIQHNGVVQATSTAVFRDPAASYHIFVRFNGSTLTEVYVNNHLVVSWANSPNLLNTAAVHSIGARATPANYLDCNVSRTCFVDGGHALTPSDFAYTDPATNQWISKSQSACKAVVDAGGANSFMLDFDNGASLTVLGYDKSSKGNNWTLNNVSLTTGVTYDWFTDTPTNNYPVLNSLRVNDFNFTFSEANLRVSDNTANYVAAVGTIRTPASGKWYFETTIVSLTVAGAGYVGVATEALADGSRNASSFPSTGVYRSDGTIKNLAGTAQTAGASYTTNDVIGVAIDVDLGTVRFYKNNVAQGAAPSFTFSAGTVVVPCVVGDNVAGTKTFAINFGQRPFAYAPPTGFKALCTKNLPAPSIKLPKKYFDVAAYTGTGSTWQPYSIDLAPDFVWIKQRSSTQTHGLFDKVRGVYKRLFSNTTNAETADSTSLTSFNANGISVGADSGVNASGAAYVAWNWKAGGAAVANNAGSIASQVSANVAAGFSIVTYTGTGANATVGHGLGVAPKLVIAKSRGAATNWGVWLAGLTSYSYYLLLNSTAAQATAANSLQALPTSSVVSVGGSSIFNDVSPMVMYCFAEVPGYSKIGSYTGNGSADGPFVWCGFRPRFLMVKRTDAAGNWVILDTARDTENITDLGLYPNLTDPEGSGARLHDFLSNGYKVRNALTDHNASGGSYIFWAIAEAPFKYANAR